MQLPERVFGKVIDNLLNSCFIAILNEHYKHDGTIENAQRLISADFTFLDQNRSIANANCWGVNKFFHRYIPKFNTLTNVE